MVAFDVQPLPLRVHPAKAGLEQFERYVWIANAKALHVVGGPLVSPAPAFTTEVAPRKTTITAPGRTFASLGVNGRLLQFICATGPAGRVPALGVHVRFSNSVSLARLISAAWAVLPPRSGWCF